MELEPTDEQRAFVGAARALLADRWPAAVARAVEDTADGHSHELWHAVAALGWPGLVLPEAVGGSGATIVDLALLAEALGAAACSSPLLPSATLAALPLLWSDNEVLQRCWLAPLAAGRAIGAPLLVAPGARDEWEDGREAAIVATRSDRALVLDGRSHLVPFASVADLFIVAARADDGGRVIAVVDARAAGIAMRRQRVLGADPLFAVELAGVAVPLEHVLAHGDHADELLARALAHATVVDVAYAVGLAEAALALCVRHANDRVQFGRPIGAFQAVAHRCVDMRSDTDACRMLAWQAAAALARGGDARLEVSAAKAYANDALRRVFLNAHQVHGAIGFTMEHDLQLYARRAKAFELRYGGADLHRHRVAESMGL